VRRTDDALTASDEGIESIPLQPQASFFDGAKRNETKSDFRKVKRLFSAVFFLRGCNRKKK